MENSYPMTHYGHNLEELILFNQIGSGFRDTLTSIHANTANVTAAVDRGSLAAVTETARTASANLQSTERNGGETRTSIERNGSETRDAIYRNGNEVREILDRFALATCHDFADVRREAVEHKYQLTLHAAENFAKAQLQASENACAVRAQIAECCCEMKELVRAENGATRALLNETESNRLRDALAASNQALLLMQINGGPGNSGR